MSTPPDTNRQLTGLDLSTLLKHAFQSGKAGIDWVDYEPPQPLFQSISAALAPTQRSPAPPDRHTHALQILAGRGHDDDRER